MSDEIASIYIEACLDLKKLNKELTDLQSRRYSLKIDTATDESALTGLNKHLESKKKHLIEINTFFARNAITPVVNDRALTQLNQNLSSTQSLLEGLQNRKIDLKINVNTSDLKKQIDEAVKKATVETVVTINDVNSQKIISKLDEVLKANKEGSSSETAKSPSGNIESLLEKTNQGFEQATKRIASSLASPFKAISTGLFENIGGVLGKDIGKGVRESIEKEFKFNFKQVGQKTGEFVGTKVIRTFTGNSSNSNNSESSTSSKTPNNTQQPINLPLQNLRNPSKQMELMPINLPAQKFENRKEVAINSTKIAKAIAEQFESPIKEAFNTLQEITKQKAPSIAEAKKAFEQIRVSFSSNYKQFQKSISDGNHDLAKIQAESLLKMSEHASKEVDTIKNNLKTSGVSGQFGSELATMAGSTKGIITSRYAKPTQQKLEQLTNYKETAKKTEGIGVDVVKGLTEGLKDTKSVNRQASLMAFGLINTFKKDLEIQSPSKVFQRFGQFVAAGFKLGITNGQASVNQVASNMVNSTIATTNKGIPKVKAVNQQNLKIAQSQNEFGTEEFFNQMYARFGSQFKKRVLKGLPKEEANALHGEILGTGFAVASMAAPATTAMTSLVPMLLPLMPMLTAGMGLQNLLTPLINKVTEALTTTQPITKRLEFLGGGVEGGKAEVNYTRNISDKYRTSTKAGLENYSQMAIAARGTKLEGEGVKDLFEGITGSIKSLNLGTYDSSLVFNAYTQILSKGKLSMEELRQQLGEKFPPAMNVFAKALGVSQQELNELVSKGAILSEDILPKVANVLKEDFGVAASDSSGSFISAITRIENAGFDLNLKLADSFGGLFAGVTNFGAGLYESFNNNFGNIAKVAGAFLIGITAQVAVATQTIMSSPAIASKIGMVQNLFMSSFKTSISSLTPFFVGVLSDIADDFFGAKHSVMDNMFAGVSNAAIALFSNLDMVFRDTFDKPLFNVSFTGDKKEKGFINDVTDSIMGLTKIIPSGVVEMGALLIMFEQTSVLGKMLLAPMFASIGGALKGMSSGFINAVSSGENLKQSLRTLVASSTMAKGAMIALGIATKVALAIAVIAFARSDFSNPISTAINSAKKSMVSSVDSMKKALEELKNKSIDVGKSLKSSLVLPSKGLELNPMFWAGLSEDSFKSDDFFANKNKKEKLSDQEKNPFIKFFREDEIKNVRNKKSEADKMGIGDFFTGEEIDFTLAQNQLFNNAKDLKVQGEQLKEQLLGMNLTPSTVKNFSTGGVKENVADLKTLDNQIEKLGSKRANLALGDLGTKLGKSNLTGYTEAKKEIASVDLEINKLLKDRKEKTKPLTSILGGVDDLKNQLKEQEDAITQSNLPRTAKNALIVALEPQKKLVAESVEYLKSQGLYKLIEPLAEVWQSVVDKLKTAEKAFDKVKKSAKIEGLNKQANIYESGLSEPAKKQTLDILNIVELTKAQSSLQKLISVREGSLSKLLTIPNVEQNKDKKEEITNLNENLGKDKEEFASNRSQLAQMRSALTQQLRDQTKTVADYYQTIVRQVRESSIEFQKQINNISTLKSKNKLSEALIGVGDNIVTQFVDSLIQNLDDLNNIKNQKLDAQSKMQSTQFQIEDAKKAGFELLKTLPGNVDGFDLVAIDSMNKGLNQTVDIVGLITGNTKDLNGVLDDSVNNTARLTEQFNKAVKASEDATKATETWKTSIDSIPNSIANISNGFTGVGTTIASLSVQTATWIGSLLNGQSLITNIANGAVAAFSGDKSQQPDWVNKIPGLQTGIDAVKGFFTPQNVGASSVKNQPFNIVESVGGSTQKVNAYSDLEKHHPSRGHEAGRSYADIDGHDEEVRKTSDGRTLIKKDFVLMDAKGRQNVSLPAPASGYAQSTGNMGTVNIYEDAKLTKLVAKALHLSNITVKTGDMVKYGQAIGTQDGIGLANRPVHSHIELEKEKFVKYIADLKSGLFETSRNMVDTRPANNAVHFASNVNQHKGARLSNNVVRGQNEAIFNQAGMSDTLIGLVKEKEGFHKNAYSDYGQNSVGFGTVAKSKNESISVEEANVRLYQELKKAQSEVISLVKVKISANQLDALTSFQYNTGGLGKSTLLKKLNAGDSAGASNEFTKWTKADGQILPGLVKRRNQEKDLFNNAAMTAYQNNQFLKPDQLQAQVKQGVNLQTQTLQTGGQIAAIQSDEEIKNAELQSKRKENLARRTLVRGQRSIVDSSIQSSREVQDLYTGLNLNKTTTESFSVEIQNKIRASEDKIKEGYRQLEDINETISAAINALAITGKDALTGENRKIVEDTIKMATQQKDQLESDLKGRRIGKALDIQAATKNFQTTEGFRQQSIGFENRSSDINLSQMQVEQTKAIIPLNGENFAKLTLSLPALEKKNQLMQIDLETEKAIAEIQQKLFKNEITSEQADKQIEQAKKLILIKQQTLDYTNQLAEAQAKLNTLQTAADTNKSQTDFLTGSKFSRKQLEIDAYKARGGNEFVANAGSRALGTEQENVRYKQELMDFDTKQQQLKIQGIDIDPAALAGVRADMEAIHGLNMDKLNTDFKTFGMSLDEIARTSVQSLGKGLTGLIMGTKSLNDVLDEFFSNILSSVLDQGISSILGGLFGGGGGLFGGGGSKGGSKGGDSGGGLGDILGGLLGGLFYDGGMIRNYAYGGATGGNLKEAFSREQSQSGKKPVFIVAHEGEMMIPAWRTNELSNMGLGQKELLGYADGGVIGNMKSSAPNRASQSGLEVAYQSTVINNQSYVTSEQFEEGVRKAAQAGAEGGFSKVQSKLSNSSSFRRSVGI